jgi:AGCS family alanine or glycine:cation symporter
MYNVHGVDETFLVANVAADIAANSPVYTQLAVDSVFTGVGKPFVAIALFFFAFTTILAYYFIAENNVYYIRRTFKVPALTFMLKALIMAATFYGTIKTADIAWGLGDIGVGIMAWLNIIGIIIIFFMAKPAIKALKDYERQQKAGVKVFTFDPVKLGIKKADFWENRIAKQQEDDHGTST